MWSGEWFRPRGRASRWAGGSRRLWQDLLRRDVLYYKGRLDMDGLEVVDLEDGKDRELHVSVRNAFRLRCGPSGESHLLCARKPEQKQRWLKAFAREREQVRLDQETGARPRLAHPALLAPAGARPRLAWLPVRAHPALLAPACRGVGMTLRPQEAGLTRAEPRGLARLRDTSWFRPQAWVTYPRHARAHTP